MPRRAILSILLLFSGALSGSATMLDPATGNTLFQPRATLKTRLVKPAQAAIMGHERRNGFKIQKFTPVWQAPAANKLGRTASKQPGEAVMPSATVKAAGGS